MARYHEARGKPLFAQFVLCASICGHLCSICTAFLNVIVVASMFLVVVVFFSWRFVSFFFVAHTNDNATTHISFGIHLFYLYAFSFLPIAHRWYTNIRIYRYGVGFVVSMILFGWGSWTQFGCAFTNGLKKRDAAIENNCSTMTIRKIW